MEMEDELKRNLRELISKSSSAQVYKALADIFNEEYSFLHKFFVDAKGVKDKKEKKEKKDVSVEAAPVNTEEQTTSPSAPASAKPDRIRSDAKVIVMKKPADPEDLLDTHPLPQAQNDATIHTESGFRDPKDIKKWQKEQEDKKHAELRAEGVNPATLLTEANLRKWIVDEKKTFAAIAREYVGLSDVIISAEAKKYGLQSDTSKRRMMIAKAKGSKN
jgi:acyl-CoA hydrolase